jgi:hypothetical protein
VRARSAGLLRAGILATGFFPSDLSLHVLAYEEPAVVHYPHWMEPRLPALAMRPIYEALRGVCTLFLIGHWWYTVDRRAIEAMREYERDHRERHPSHDFVHLCNTREEQHAMAERGLATELCSHNCFG